MGQSEVIAITLIFYQVLLISIGIWASKKIKNNTDFLLGGRQLGAWVAGLSYAAAHLRHGYFLVLVALFFLMDIQHYG